MPHPRTITKWFSSVNGEPGFTEEAFRILKNKNEEYVRKKKTLLCSLMMDEMAIRQRVEWTGKKFTGFVNMGTDLDTDELPEAKEALVFMLVAVNGHWK